MPHIIVEHSSEVNDKIKVSKLNEILHKNVCENENFKPASVKTRSTEVNNVIIGTGENNNFIHVTVKILPGRSEDVKKSLSEELFLSLKDFVTNSGFEIEALSVEILNLGTYKK